MRFITGLLVALTLSKKPTTTTEQPAAEAPPASPIERTLENPKSYAIKMLAACTPTGKDLVGRDQAAPNEYNYSLYGSGGLAVGQSIDVGAPGDFMKPIQGNRPIDILKGLPQGASEVARTYAHRTGYQALQDSGAKVAFDKNYRNLYLGMDLQILVTDGPHFSTRQIVQGIPIDMHMGRFRFVDGSDGTGGQEGIYGLVDRLVGTEIEARVAVDVLNCGWVDAGLSAGNWLDLYSSAETALFATREMRYYVLQYLRYAKDQEGSVFQSALDNKPLMRAIAEADARADALQIEYEQKGAALAEAINAKGLQASFGDTAVRVGDDGRNRYTDQRGKLNTAFASPGLTEIAEAVAARSK